MKRRHIALVLAVLVLAVAYFYVSNPQRHAATFVSIAGDSIEDAVRAGEALPEDLGCLNVATWHGSHDMMEFTLSGWGLGAGTRYYGCYYSPDDVPLPFQNTDLPLTQKGDTWVWQEDGGDNRGMTRKLRDNWYYFEVSF